MMGYGPAVLTRDQLHDLRTLHAAQRNARQLCDQARTLAQLDHATTLLVMCREAIQLFWWEVRP